MEQIYKIRIIATLLKGHRRIFRHFTREVLKLECGDDHLKILNTIFGSATYGEDIVVSPGQWIISDKEHIEFCISGSDPSTLVEVAGSLADFWECAVHAVWAGKITELSYFVPWCSASLERNYGLSFFCATMGRAVFYGDHYGFCRAPLKSDKNRQNEYYSFVWGKPKGVEEMKSFFNDEFVWDGRKYSHKNASRDEITYPIRTIIDDYGNKIYFGMECEVHGHVAFGNEEIYALPVRKMLVEGETADKFLYGTLMKYDKVFEKVLRDNQINGELEYLRCTHLATEDYTVDSGGFLLDKKGNKIKSLKDFDHAVDSDGEIYYRVYKSECDEDSLSSEASEKWLKKLGLSDFLQDEDLLYNEDKTDVIELINKKAKIVRVPEGVKRIRPNVFKQCASLEEISLPSTLTEIGATAFDRCTSLKSIEIPDGVKILGSTFSSFSGVFSGCTSLENVTLSKNLEKIDIFTFSKCSSLKKLVIPRSVKEIVKGAFDGCTSLSELIIEDGNENYSAKDGLIYSENGTVLHSCMPAVKGTVKILDTVQKFDSGPLSFNKDIKKIILPAALTQLSLCTGFGDFECMSEDLEIVFSNTKGWYGTDDFKSFNERKGGHPIPPEKLNDALKKYEFLYNTGFFMV